MGTGIKAIPVAAVLTCACAAAFVASPASAVATSPKPAWSINAVSGPTNLPPASGGVPGSGTFAIYLTNVGGASTSGPVTVTDVLPAGLTASETGTYEPSFGTSCTPEAAQTRVRCTLEPSVEPGLPTLEPILVPVHVEATAGVETNAITVSGGSAAAEASLAESVTISSTPAPAGIESFTAGAYDEEGRPVTQAGAHPYAVTTGFFVNTRYNESHEVVPSGTTRNVEVQLPPGLIGNPQAVPQCAEGISKCSENRESLVGTATSFTAFGDFEAEVGGVANLAPVAGTPAEFGFIVLIAPIHLLAHVRSDGDYGITISAPDIPQLGPRVFGSVVTFWGKPADPSHNSERCEVHVGSFGIGCEASKQPDKPFLAEPTDCAKQAAEPPSTTLALNSWETPIFDVLSVPLAPVSGCAHVPFQPSLSVQPTTGAADTPTGLEVDLHMPQQETAEGVSEAQLRDAVVTLPPGVVVSPSSANGLAACSPSQIGLEEDSPVRFNLNEPACPEASKLGMVEIQTPLLEKPLDGSIYLAEQGNNPFHSLVAIYLAIDDPTTGIVIKLAGHVEANEQTGQLTTSFDEDPQLPFSNLKLDFKSGERAPLVTPSACGTYTTISALTPWSAPERALASPSSSFQITSGPGGAACAHQRFAPSFAAGTTDNQAGGYSPLSLTLSRNAGEQTFSTVAVTLPPGVAGMISKVQQCAEAQANAGDCPAASKIGHVTVVSGEGIDPITLPQAGKPEDSVYLTGPYKGAPFGLAIVVPAEAGPFSLGTVVVRAKIDVNPHTAQVTVVSEPIPQILQGIPVDVRSLNVTIDREGFAFNPTNCDAESVAGTLTSGQGASSSVSSRFQAADCASLPFKPTFKAETHAGHTKKSGAFLKVSIGSGEGQANLAKVHVTLPKALPSVLETLKQACTEAQFAANPAGCPAAATVGTAVVHTPVLSKPLEGPAIFVSHGHAAFPDLDLVLQGEGVTIIQEGNTEIKKGFTSSTFAAIPDLPVSNIELTLRQGEKPALAGEGNLCKKPLDMPTTITGQNGAVVEKTTVLKVKGCRTAFKILSHEVKRRTLTLKVQVPAAGKLTAGGKGLTTKSEPSTGSETLTLRLEARKQGKLKAKIKVVFKPKSGKRRTKTLAVEFKAAGRGAAGQSAGGKAAR